MTEHAILENDPIKNAETHILVLRQEIAAMGGNDYEIPALDDLIKCLKAGTCTPDDALKQAKEIRSRKQDNFI
ncbi:MAG: hypothetical protein V4699_02760 [Patescibacteria group bacterium]